MPSSYVEPVCHTWADCTDTEGSFECKCKDGYEGNGYECAEIDLCSPAGRCNNGKCVILPTQDIIAGIYYLTRDPIRNDEKTLVIFGIIM